MALIFESSFREPVKGLGTRIFTLLASRWKWARRKFAVRRTRRALEELPDWILSDIGISRGEVHYLSTVVNGPGREGEDRSWRSLL